LKGPTGPVRCRADRHSGARFEFKEGSIRVNTEGVGGEVAELDLPTVKLENLSGTPAEIGTQSLDVYLARAINTLAAGRLKSEAQKEVGKVKKKPGAAARSLLGGDDR
jgi:hypothetical protein